MIEATGVAAETIRMLYPDPWTVTTRPVRGGGPRRGFLLMPNMSGTRMIVPAGPRPVLTVAAQQQIPEVRTTMKAKQFAFRAMAASGLAGVSWPYRLHVAGEPGADSLESWLQRRLGLRRCRLSIRLGPARANRKPVVQVLDQAGAVRAYVKVGHDALNTSLVATEAGVLAHLERAGLQRMRVPRVLAYDEWNGMRLLALEPLPVSGAATDPDDVRAAADEIAASAERVSVRWRKSSFRGRLIRSIASGGARLAPLDDVVARLDHADPVVEFGAWHGDFNPGNFASGPDGLLVWDWERYDNDVPVGFDMLHLTMQQAITISGRDPRDAATDLLTDAGALPISGPRREEAQWDRPAYVPTHAAPRAPMATAPEHREPEPDGERPCPPDEVARLYLAWLACRYVHDGQERADARLGAVEEWIIPALASAR